MFVYEEENENHLNSQIDDFKNPVIFSNYLPKFHINAL